MNSTTFQFFVNTSPATTMQTFKVIHCTIFSQSQTNSPNIQCPSTSKLKKKKFKSRSNCDLLAPEQVKASLSCVRSECKIVF